jgi:4-phytase/acid phosphatase
MIRAAGGRLDNPVARNPALFIAMQAVLAPDTHAFLDVPRRIILRGPTLLPALYGPLPVARSAAAAFSMEYAEGMAMHAVAWGRADKELILQFLAFPATEFAITLRPLVIARFAAGPLARRVLDGLTALGAPDVTILVGQDTNIAPLAALFDLHWRLADYPTDEPAPGGGLIFTLLRDPGSGGHYVTVRYMAQTLDQMRDLVRLTDRTPPPSIDIPIPGCGQSVEPRACPLVDFMALVPQSP